MRASDIAAMHWLVTLTDDELELAEMALLALANRFRRDAARQENPVIRGGFEKRAADYERAAERMKRARSGG